MDPMKHVAQLRIFRRLKKGIFYARLFYEFLRLSGGKRCANRFEQTVTLKDREITLIVKDTTQPDGYGREELYEMLELIRKHERIQGWKVPESQEL
jgi:hypothetical protein